MKPSTTLSFQEIFNTSSSLDFGHEPQAPIMDCEGKPLPFDEIIGKAVKPEHLQWEPVPTQEAQLPHVKPSH